MTTNNVQTVEKALKILILISQKSLTLTEICKKTNYNKSTVHRLLSTLHEYQFVEKNQDTGKYSIGLKVVELSSMKLNRLELKTEAAYYLRQLAKYVGQAVHLGIYSDKEVVYIEKIEPINTLRMYSEIGKRTALYSSSLGKALLAGFSNQKIMEILEEVDMVPHMPNTITSIEQLIQEIEVVKETGYAIDNEENEQGIFCLGAPIYDYKGKVIAALSTSGRYAEFVKDEAIIQKVIETASDISTAMGYKQ